MLSEKLLEVLFFFGPRTLFNNAHLVWIQEKIPAFRLFLKVSLRVSLRQLVFRIDDTACSALLCVVELGVVEALLLAPVGLADAPLQCFDFFLTLEVFSAKDRLKVLLGYDAFFSVWVEACRVVAQLVAHGFLRELADNVR